MPETANHDPSAADLKAAIREAMDDPAVTAMTEWYARGLEPLGEPTGDDEEAYRARLAANGSVFVKKIEEAFREVRDV